MQNKTPPKSSELPPGLELDRQVFALFFAGFDEALDKIGDHVVKRLDAVPRLREIWKSEIPRLNEDVLMTLERIGRKQLSPELYMLACSGNRAASHLLLAPYSVQQRCLSEPIAVVTKVGRNFRTDYRRLAELRTNEIPQVFDYHRVRSIEAQEAWLEEQSTRTPERDFEYLPDGRIKVRRNTILPEEAILHAAGLINARRNPKAA